MKPTIGNTMKKIALFLLLLSTLTINYCQVFVITPRANLTRPDEPEWTEYYDYWDGGTILYNFLNWNQVSGATKYYIYRAALSDNSGGDDIQAGGSPGWDINVIYDSTESSEYYDYNVGTMVRYTYVVSAYNSTLPDTLAMSGQSNIASIYIEEAPIALTAPTWIGVGDFYYGYYNEVTDTTLQFGFYDRSNNELGFIIFRADTGVYSSATAIDTIAAVSGANTIVTYLDTTVLASTKYWYWVTAYTATQTAITIGSHSNTTLDDPASLPYIYVINGDMEDGISYGYVLRDISGNTMVESMTDTTISGDVKLLLKVTTPGTYDSRPSLQAWYNRAVESGREYTFSVTLTELTGDMRLRYIGLGAGVKNIGGVQVAPTGTTYTTVFTATSNTFMEPTLYFDGTLAFTGLVDNWTIDTTGADTGLTVPTIASITPSYTSLTVVWNAVVGANGYLIQHSTDGLTWGGAINVSGTSYYHSGLAEGTLHYYRVAATDGVTITSYSTVSYTQTLMTPQSGSHAYYVSTSGTGTGIGTQASPWTLGQLNSNSGSLVPGDSVLFRRGDIFAPDAPIGGYSVLQLASIQGQKGNIIYFGDYGNKSLQRPIISDRNIPSGVYHQTFRTGGAAYVTFQNIRVEGEAQFRVLDNLTIGFHHVTFDSCDFVSGGNVNGYAWIYTGYNANNSHFPMFNDSFLINGTAVRFQSCYFNSTYSQDLLNLGVVGDSCYIGFCTFVNGGEQGFDIGNGNYHLIEYNLFVNCRYPFKMHSQMGYCNNAIIRGNMAINATEGMALENMANCVVVNNVMHGVYSATLGNRDRLPVTGYYGDFTGNIIANNIFNGIVTIWGGWNTATLTSSYGTRTVTYHRPVDNFALLNTFRNNIYNQWSSANNAALIRYVYPPSQPPTAPVDDYFNVVPPGDLQSFKNYWTDKFPTGDRSSAEATEIVVPPANIFANPTYTDVNNIGNWAVDRSTLAAYCSTHEAASGTNYDEDGYNTSAYFPNYLELQVDNLRNFLMPKRGAATTSTVTRGALESVP